MEQIAGLDDCVVVVIDVQNDFCSVNGAMHCQGIDIEMISSMLPSLAAFLDQVRKLGGKIIFTRHRFEPGQLPPALRERNRMLFRGDGFPVPNSWGDTFCPPVVPVEGEPVLIKHRYSVFSNGDFTGLLARYGAKTL